MGDRGHLFHAGTGPFSHFLHTETPSFLPSFSFLLLREPDVQPASAAPWTVSDIRHRHSAAQCGVIANSLTIPTEMLKSQRRTRTTIMRLFLQDVKWRPRLATVHVAPESSGCQGWWTFICGQITLVLTPLTYRLTITVPYACKMRPAGHGVVPTLWSTKWLARGVWGAHLDLARECALRLFFQFPKAG